MRRSAAHALGEIGPGAKGAADALSRALKGKDEGVREAAREALQRLGAARPRPGG